MGGYCRYCDRRCFLLRVLNNGETRLLATCTRGKEHDYAACGETAETACNPVLSPRRAARLGVLRELRSCTRHGMPECPGSDCRKVRRELLLTAAQPGEDEAADPLEQAGARFPVLSWAGHGRPRAAVFYGVRTADPLDFLRLRHLVGKPCVFRREEVPKERNGVQAGSEVVARFADGTELRFGNARRIVLAPLTGQASPDESDTVPGA